MSRRIAYYFSLLSPWAYIGHRFFVDIARRHGVAIDYRPVLLNEVFLYRVFVNQLFLYQLFLYQVFPSKV